MAWKYMLFLSFAMMSKAQVIPKDRILQITPICGSDGIEDANVNVITDLHIEATAECAQGSLVPLTTTNNVTFTIPVSYPGQGSQSCVFNQRNNSRVFVIKVVVSFGEPGRLVHREHTEYTITCTFDPKSTDDSEQSNIDDALIAPTELKNMMGEVSNSTLVLQLTDVLGNNITGRDVWRSRKVYLSGWTSGDNGEVGVRPVSCDAIGDSSRRYAVLRAGCGDGIIFAKDQGFNTTGLFTRSPYFESFGIEEDTHLRFECNFTLCATNCDGSSCTNERKRRSSREEGETIAVVSDHVVLEKTPPQEQVNGHSKRLFIEDVPPTSSAGSIYWSAILGVGLLVLTSLAISLTICFSPRRVRVKEVVKT